MPANRSRTDRWRECLRQVMDRNGPLEISVETSGGDEATRPVSLIWRVRILGITDNDIRVEVPVALGRPVALGEGTRLAASMTIGQNRWMFRTAVLAVETGPGPGSLRLELPETVERCQRRAHYRVSTVELYPAPVECWPLLDPESALPAEIANRAAVLDAIRTGTPASGEAPLLPEVGPKFAAHLANVGGGGLGLTVGPSDASSLDRVRLFWLRVNLGPYVPVPIAVTARLAHTHLDSSQNLYAGMAFEFGFHPSHRAFVVEQIMRYATMSQRAQTERRVSA